MISTSLAITKWSNILGTITNIVLYWTQLVWAYLCVLTLLVAFTKEHSRGSARCNNANHNHIAYTNLQTMLLLRDRLTASSSGLLKRGEDNTLLQEEKGACYFRLIISIDVISHESRCIFADSFSNFCFAKWGRRKNALSHFFSTRYRWLSFGKILVLSIFFTWKRGNNSFIAFCPSLYINQLYTE